MVVFDHGRVREMEEKKKKCYASQPPGSSFIILSISEMAVDAYNISFWIEDEALAINWALINKKY